MPSLRTVVGAVAGPVAAGLVAAALLVPTGGAAAAPHYPVGDAASGYAQLLAHPDGVPAGMNDWSCRPSATHPRPVILLPGTLWSSSPASPRWHRSWPTRGTACSGSTTARRR